MSTMQGRRLTTSERSPRFTAGDYWHDAEGHWWCAVPTGDLGRLDGHQVIEHEDGTISVEPSILLTEPQGGGLPERTIWHGYLRHGVWEGD